MNDSDRKIAEQLKNKLIDEIKLIDFRVFGSRALGTNDEYSDMDIFIEVEHLDRSIKNLIFSLTWEIAYSNNIVITPIIYSKDEIENSPLRSSPLVKNIFSHGITV